MQRKAGAMTRPRKWLTNSKAEQLEQYYSFWTERGAGDQDLQYVDDVLDAVSCKATVEDATTPQSEIVESFGGNYAAYIAEVRKQRKDKKDADRAKIERLKRALDLDETIDRECAYLEYAKARGFSTAHINAVLNKRGP
jgi:hypothetical protein